MRTKHIKFMMVLLIIMGLTVLAPIALAAEVRSGEIPVTVSLSGALPTVDEDYEIILKADNPANPMPTGSVLGTFSMLITGANTVKMPEIKFSSLGIYTYTIFQKAGTNELGTYDSGVYHLSVYVTNAENGSGFETTILLNKLGDTKKLDEIVFHNKYDPKPAPAPAPQQPKTDDETVIWPYIGLFISGAGILLILGLTLKRQRYIK